MDLYSVIQLQPATRPQAVTAEQQLLVLGDFPAEVDTKLPVEKASIIEQAITHWHDNPPDSNTNDWQQQRNRVLSQCQQQDYNFLFEFHSGDEIPLACYQEDIENLFHRLEQVSHQAGINIKLSNSI